MRAIIGGIAVGMGTLAVGLLFASLLVDAAL